ncbi:MAG: thiamine-phosphate kinase [Planctomycetota bacterium]
MREDDWIAQLKARFSHNGADGMLGPGDDAALLPIPADEVAAISVDAMVEDVHFRSHWLTDYELGRRILCVSLSDLAAMAATARGVLLAFQTPTLPGRFTEQFWDGVAATLDEFDIALLGGNVTRTPGPVALTCTVVGSVPAARAIRRDSARVNDELWVTGLPGCAARARRSLESGDLQATNVRAWTHPQPRLAEASALAGLGAMTAAIDISDGLGIDLQRLLTASGRGAIVDLTSIVEDPIAQKLGLTIRDVLEGGEDYELLFAAPPGKILGLKAEFETQRGTKLHALGRVTAARGIEFRGDGLKGYAPAGWDPFQT